MTRIDGLTLTEAEHAIETAHPGWHLYHSWKDDGSPAREYATIPEAAPTDPTLPVEARSVERIEEAIGQWEHVHGLAVAS